MATLKDCETTIKLLFRVNGDGPIESVRAEARGPAVRYSVISTPWKGRWSNYELPGGMRIPLDDEMAANLNFGNSGCLAHLTVKLQTQVKRFNDCNWQHSFTRRLTALGRDLPVMLEIWLSATVLERLVEFKGRQYTMNLKLLQEVSPRTASKTL